MKVTNSVNGVNHERDVEPRTLFVLSARGGGQRHACRLRHVELRCRRGMDGDRAVKSCTMFAAQADGHEMIHG
jgi:carbon-monoxide dehydrogenase small subunit